MKKIITNLIRSESGVVHILPLLLIVAAVGMISYLLISSTAPFRGGIFSTLFPREASNAASGGFLETFAYGAPAAPQPFNSPRWQLVAGDLDGLTEIPGTGEQQGYSGVVVAGHGPHCEAPLGNADPSLNNHNLLLPVRDQNGNIVYNTTPPYYNASSLTPNANFGPGPHIDDVTYHRDIAPQQFYICNNHMMDVMWSGYNINTFMPRYLLDWNGGRTQTIQFDNSVALSNTLTGFARNWFDIYVVPQDEMMDWMVENNQGGPAGAIPRRAINFQFQGYPGTHLIDNYDNVYNSGGPEAYCNAVSDPACSDPRIRRTFRITFNQNSWTFEVLKPDGTWYSNRGNFPHPLSFNTALMRIQHHTYNPSKDGWSATPFSALTYHWANISFDGPANPAMTAYLASPDWVNLNQPGNQQTLHVNITNSAISNPRLTMQVESELEDEDSDEFNQEGWLQVRANGGSWVRMTNVRCVNGSCPALNADPTHPGQGQTDQQTFRASLTGLHTGDNTIDVLHGPNPSRFATSVYSSYPGISAKSIELQVDPTSDMPPANPTGGTVPTSTPAPSIAGTATPRPTATPIATVTPAPTQTPVPTVPPTSAPIPPGAVTIFGTQTPNITTDTNPYELGVKFRSTVGGQVSGVRFYKGSSNTGTHTGSLWNTSGTRLATATFTNESSAGWQQVGFSSPVTITANTTYIVSYHSDSGHYGQLVNGFTSANATNGPLTALQSGVDGANGVFAPGTTSNFPNQSWNNSNYFVDVLFIPSVVATATPAPTATPRPSATPVATATPAPGVPTTVTFDSNLGTMRVDSSLTGQYPTGVINWGTPFRWLLSGPWLQFRTNSFSFYNNNLTSGTFSFVTPKVLVSIKAFNGGNSSTNLTFACSGNTTRTLALGANQLTTVATNWTAPCTNVTITSSNSWYTNFDDLIYR